MDKQRMTFDIDRRTVTEGDVVEVKWQCDEAESVQLTIDNGFRSTDIPLETSGSKRFRLNRSKGRTHLTIAVVIGGKSYRKRIDVRVKKIPTVRTETVDQQGRRQGALKQWWQRRLTNWHNWRGRMKLAMQALPERKQLAAKLMAIMGVILLLSAIWPQVYSFALVVLVLYLGFVLLRR
ncbi:MAG: hypothetical protein J5641_06930 [Bacteroidales bacterium]|nr:hypothetical protein [Bacteroidales bacterium]